MNALAGKGTPLPIENGVIVTIYSADDLRSAGLKEDTSERLARYLNRVDPMHGDEAAIASMISEETTSLRVAKRGTTIVGFSISGIDTSEYDIIGVQNGKLTKGEMPDEAGPEDPPGDPDGDPTEGGRRRSRLNKKTRRSKRNGRSRKSRKLRKLTTRRR